MKEQIEKLTQAHDEFMKLHIEGAECITFSNAIIAMTQAINELQEQEQSDTMDKEEKKK